MNDDICQMITSLIEIEPEYRLLDWIDISYVYWKFLSSNYYGIHLLIKNYDKIDWDELSENEHPEALKLLKQNPHLINWSNLSKNPNDEAIELLIQNPHLIDWRELSFNKNHRIIEIIKKNSKKFNWKKINFNNIPN
jgi:hypothetical protein